MRTIIGGLGSSGASDSARAGGVINLTKGEKINLSKEAPGLEEIMVGLGWDCNKYHGGDDFDLDASAFLVNKYGRTDNAGFIFYGNLVGWNECVVHQGDNLTGGEGDGETTDDEQIKIDLSKIPADIEKIAITVTIYEAEKRRQNFGLVSNAYCRLINTKTGKEVVRFDLGEDFSVETAVVIGEIYRHKDGWKFNAIGSGFDGGLLALCKHYGINAEYR